MTLPNVVHSLWTEGEALGPANFVQLRTISADRHLVKACPECHFLIDDDAGTCKFCGASSTAAAERGSDPEAVAEARTESMSTRLVATVIVVAALLVVGVGWWALGSGSETGDETSASTTAVPAPGTADAAATTTTVVALSPTTAPKAALGGETQEIGVPGVFAATVPADFSDEGASGTLGYIPITHSWMGDAGDATIVINVAVDAEVPPEMQDSRGRLDPVRYAIEVGSADAPVPSVTRGTYELGPGGDWSIDDDGVVSRSVVIDGGANVYEISMISIFGPASAEAVRTFLAIVGSFRPA